jgi:hypothetical protein
LALDIVSFAGSHRHGQGKENTDNQKNGQSTSPDPHSTPPEIFPYCNTLSSNMEYAPEKSQGLRLQL